MVKSKETIDFDSLFLTIHSTSLTFSKPQSSTLEEYERIKGGHCPSLCSRTGIYSLPSSLSRRQSTTSLACLPN